MEPPPGPNARTTKAHLRGTLSNVARAFDPETQAARDESRQAQLFESVHMQHLAAQLRDHEVEIWGLCEQMFHLQREVDCECCHADKAKTELRFLEQMGTSVSERGRHDPMARRGNGPSALQYKSPRPCHIFDFASSSPSSAPLPPLNAMPPSPALAITHPHSSGQHSHFEDTSVLSSARCGSPVHLPPIGTGPSLGLTHLPRVPHLSAPSPSSNKMPIPWSPSP